MVEAYIDMGKVLEAYYNIFFIRTEIKKREKEYDDLVILSKNFGEKPNFKESYYDIKLDMMEELRSVEKLLSNHAINVLSSFKKNHPEYLEELVKKLTDLRKEF